MSELSIKLSGLGAGTNILPNQEIYSVHKDRIQQYLSSFFSKQGVQGERQEIPFELHLENEGPVLYMGGRKVALQEPSKLKSVERVVQYYQHTGQLARKPGDDSFVKPGLQKTVKAMCDASIPGANGQVISGMHITEDTLGLVRSMIYAASPLGTADPIGTHLGYYTGVLGAFFAFRELDLGRTEYNRAKLIGDAEGERRSKARMLSGAVISAASAAHLTEKFLEPVLAASVSTCMSLAAGALFGLGSFLNLGLSSLGALRCHRFNGRLNEYLDNPLLSEEQRMSGALQFLKDQMCVTVEERDALVCKIDQAHPDWTPEQKAASLTKEIQDRIEVKVKYMKRRTSNTSLHLILTQADSILAKIHDPKNAAEGIKEASILLHKVQSENKTKLLLYALSIVAALLGLLGMLLFIFFPPLATLPFILYGIAGTIYLGITIYTAIGVFKRRGIEAKDTPDKLTEAETSSETEVPLGAEAHSSM